MRDVYISVVYISRRGWGEGQAGCQKYYSPPRTKYPSNKLYTYNDNDTGTKHSSTLYDTDNNDGSILLYHR